MAHFTTIDVLSYYQIDNATNLLLKREKIKSKEVAHFLYLFVMHLINKLIHVEVKRYHINFRRI